MSADARQRILGLALEKVTVGREQHLGLDLAEAIQDTLDAEIG